MGKASDDIIAWVDLETTGLMPVKSHQILEIAVVVTDAHLRMCHLGPSIVIQPERELSMEPIVAEMHTKSGLLKAIEEGGNATLAQAEKQCLDFLNEYAPAGTIPMGGSSVGFDKRYIEEYMPTLFDWFHYRVVDVSSFNEIFSRWFPEIRSHAPESRDFHRAQEDIIDSISRLRFYREKMMISMGLKNGLF